MSGTSLHELEGTTRARPVEPPHRRPLPRPDAEDPAPRAGPGPQGRADRLARVLRAASRDIDSDGPEAASDTRPAAADDRREDGTCERLARAGLTFGR